MTKKRLEQIIARDMPGYRLASHALGADRASSAEPDLVAPDITALKRKYFGADALPEADNPGHRATRARAAKPKADVEEQIVAVEPKEGGAFDAAARPKTVVISNGKIVARQG